MKVEVKEARRLFILPPSSFILVFTRQEHTSTLPVCSIVCPFVKHADYQGALIGGQLFRQTVERKPGRGFYLEAARLCLSIGLALIDQLHLAMAERSGKSDLDAVEFQAYFLSQFTAQRCFRLFISIDEAAGNAPATAGSKDMFQQQYLSLFVHYHGAGADDKSHMTKASQEKANAAGSQTEQQCQKIFQHNEELNMNVNSKS